MVSSIEYVNIHKVPAYLAGYDMVMAYDCVFLSLLDKVMVAMNFPDKFISWVMMLHSSFRHRQVDF